MAAKPLSKWSWKEFVGLAMVLAILAFVAVGVLFPLGALFAGLFIPLAPPLVAAMIAVPALCAIGIGVITVGNYLLTLMKPPANPIKEFLDAVGIKIGKPKWYEKLRGYRYFKKRIEEIVKKEIKKKEEKTKKEIHEEQKQMATAKKEINGIIKDLESKQKIMKVALADEQESQSIKAIFKKAQNNANKNFLKIQEQLKQTYKTMPPAYQTLTKNDLTTNLDKFKHLFLQKVGLLNTETQEIIQKLKKTLDKRDPKLEAQIRAVLKDCQILDSFLKNPSKKIKDEQMTDTTRFFVSNAQNRLQKYDQTTWILSGKTLDELVKNKNIRPLLAKFQATMQAKPARARPEWLQRIFPGSGRKPTP